MVSAKLKRRPRPPVVGDGSAQSLALRSEPDRRSLLKRRSPFNRRSSSDRLSTPLRRSVPDRRPAFDGLSSLVMRLLRRTGIICAVANNPISTADGVLAGKKSASNFAPNSASADETADACQANPGIVEYR
jgi:hypothetical protein